MCEEHLGHCFVLRALHRLPSHSSVFIFCFPCFNFFSVTVFKRKIISQSVLTWLKILVLVFFFFCALSEMQYVFWQYHTLVIFYILQHGCKFSSLLMVNSYFDHPRLATKFASMLQDTCDLMCATDDSFVSVQTV